MKEPMREIKFEFAGQTSDGTWILSRPFTLNEIGIGWVAQFVASSNPPVHMDQLIARQFTGLVDKNEKEIYEGDIVKFDGHTNDEKFTSEIVYSQGMFRPKSWSEPLGFYKYREVIGNIYETPDLATP